MVINHTDAELELLEAPGEAAPCPSDSAQPTLYRLRRSQQSPYRRHPLWAVRIRSASATTRRCPTTSPRLEPASSNLVAAAHCTCIAMARPRRRPPASKRPKPFTSSAASTATCSCTGGLAPTRGTEAAPATLCFNGDFNWFNVDDACFTAINQAVLDHDACLVMRRGRVAVAGR